MRRRTVEDARAGESHWFARIRTLIMASVLVAISLSLFTGCNRTLAKGEIVKVAETHHIKLTLDDKFVTSKGFIVYPPPWMPKDQWEYLAQHVNDMWDEFVNYWAGIVEVVKHPATDVITIVIHENKNYIKKKNLEDGTVEFTLGYSFPDLNMTFVAWREKFSNPLYAVYHEWAHIVINEMMYDHKVEFLWNLSRYLEMLKTGGPLWLPPEKSKE